MLYEYNVTIKMTERPFSTEPVSLVVENQFANKRHGILKFVHKNCVFIQTQVIKGLLLDIYDTKQVSNIEIIFKKWPYYNSLITHANHPSVEISIYSLRSPELINQFLGHGINNGNTRKLNLMVCKENGNRF